MALIPGIAMSCCCFAEHSMSCYCFAEHSMSCCCFAEHSMSCCCFAEHSMTCCCFAEHSMSCCCFAEHSMSCCCFAEHSMSCCCFACFSAVFRASIRAGLLAWILSVWPTKKRITLWYKGVMDSSSLSCLACIISLFIIKLLHHSCRGSWEQFHA